MLVHLSECINSCSPPPSLFHWDELSVGLVQISCERLLWAAVQTDADWWEHTTQILCSKSGFTAWPQFPLAGPLHSHQASHPTRRPMCITTFPKGYRDWLEIFLKYRQETKIPWALRIPLSSLVSGISSQMTHNSSETDLDRDKIKAHSPAFWMALFMFILFPLFFKPRQHASPLLAVLKLITCWLTSQLFYADLVAVCALHLE